jgi:methionyl-tRNA formyltransferase
MRKQNPMDAKTVVFIGSIMQVPEYIFHQNGLKLTGIITEAGKTNDDLLTFSALRGITITEVSGKDELIEAAKKLNADLFIMCGFGIKIPDEIISKTDSYNIHPSTLPHYRGRHPTFWATMNGESSMGITLHKVASKIDTGDIIAQKSCPYYAWMSEPDIFNVLLQQIPALLGGLQKFLEGEKKSEPNLGGSYFKPVEIADYTINLDSDSIADILNKVRAQKRHKGARLKCAEKSFWVKEAKVTQSIRNSFTRGDIYQSIDGSTCIFYDQKISLKLIAYEEE